MENLNSIICKKKEIKALEPLDDLLKLLLDGSMTFQKFNVFYIFRPFHFPTDMKRSQLSVSAENSQGKLELVNDDIKRVAVNLAKFL